MNNIVQCPDTINYNWQPELAAAMARLKIATLALTAALRQELDAMAGLATDAALWKDSPLDRTLIVTIFPNKTAASKTERIISLRDLASDILAASALTGC